MVPLTDLSARHCSGNQAAATNIEAVDTASGMKKLHKLRIKVKRVRYFQEALAPIPHYRDEQFLAALKRVQTAIGKIHDAYQIKSLLDQVDAGGVDEKIRAGKRIVPVLAGQAGYGTNVFYLPKPGKNCAKRLNEVKSAGVAAKHAGASPITPTRMNQPVNRSYVQVFQLDQIRCRAKQQGSATEFSVHSLIVGS